MKKLGLRVVKMRTAGMLGGDIFCKFFFFWWDAGGVCGGYRVSCLEENAKKISFISGVML